MTAWLALLLLSQEGVDELLRRLDADSIESRTEAADLLLRRGPSVIPALEKARLGADGEWRGRIDALLVRARDRERLSTLLKPPTLITLDLKARPLKEVVGLLRERAPTLVEAADEVAERSVSVTMKDLPFWRALEVVARAAGEVRVETSDGGARFVAGPSGPTAVFDAFAARLERLHTFEETEFGTPGRSLRTSLLFRLNWEKGTRPTRIRAALDRFDDDTGSNAMEGLLKVPEELLLRPAGAAGAEWTLSLSGGPSATAKRVSLRVVVEVEFALHWGELTFPAPWAVGQSRENAEFGARLAGVFTGVSQRRDQISLSLKVNPRGTAGAADLSALLSVLDETGRSTTFSTRDYRREGASLQFNATLVLPPGRSPKELRLSVPVEMHTERFVLEFPDLRIR